MVFSIALGPPSWTDTKFTVIIVGGSIAGLTLAHCLERADIDYIVLERHHDIAPQVGASIGIMPNGARILDQLGLFDAVEAEVEALKKTHICYPDGFSFTSDFPRLMNERFGYPLSFLERQRFLAILYENLRGKSRVHLSKEVVKVQQINTTMRVFTKDGCCYDGDLVVGADGVHSSVRSQMWQIADSIRPGLIPPREKTAMFAEYSCVFGTSSAVPGLVPGEQVIGFFNGFCTLTFGGKGGRVFWFVIEKMDKKYYSPNIPRFTKLDAQRHCKRFENTKIWGDVTFGHIWASLRVCSMSALEENVFDNWNLGRIVCLGDSVHKMTPNLGQGANCAIESAAALANTLHDMINVHHIKRPSNTEIEARLRAFTKVRRKRASSICQSAGLLTRLQSRDGLINRFLGRYIAPFVGDLPTDMTSNIIVGSEKVDYIGLPQRSVKGRMQFHPDLEENGGASSWMLVLKCLMFLLFAVLVIRMLLVYMQLW